MSFKHKRVSRCAGFTLVEVIIVAAIIGILAAIAIPAYQGRVLATHRKAAVADMLGLQQELERSYILNNGKYSIGTASRTSGSPSRYSFGVTISDNGQSYTITATPTAIQAGEECGYLRVDSDDVREVSETGTSWSIDGSCF